MAKQFIGPDTGNKVYITCSCGDEPLELGRRGKLQYGKTPQHFVFEDWFERHSKCAGGPDKWKLGYAYTPNYDQSKDADPVSNGVRLALINGSSL